MKNDSDNDIQDKDTPILNDTGGYPLLQSTAKDMIEKLHLLDQNASAAGMSVAEVRQRLTALVAILGSWTEKNQPTNEEKNQAVDETMLTLKIAQTFLKREAVNDDR